MLKSKQVRFRVEPRHAEKLRIIKAQTGIAGAELFRRMLENVEVKQVQIDFNLSAGNGAGAVGARQVEVSR